MNHFKLYEYFHPCVFLNIILFFLNPVNFKNFEINCFHNFFIFLYLFIVFFAHLTEDCNVQSLFEDLNLFLLFSFAAQAKISSLNFITYRNSFFDF